MNPIFTHWRERVEGGEICEAHDPKDLEWDSHWRKKKERTVIGNAKKNMSQCKQDYGATLDTNRFSETNPKH